MTIQKQLMFPFIFGICASMFAQDAQVKQRIIQDYDQSKVSYEILEVNKSFNKLNQEAIHIAKAKNLPISGVTSDGRFFELQGLFANGDLKYYTNYNAGSRATLSVNDISTGGSLNLDLNGQNMVIGLLEGTIALESHVEFADENGDSRIIPGEYFKPITDYTTNQALGSYLANKTHATHTAGTLIAKGVDPKAKGMAPEASIKMLSWNNDASKMITNASQGLLVSNHSYGISVVVPNGQGGYMQAVHPGNFGLYEQEAVLFDRIMHAYKYYQPVMAAGNDQGWATQVNPTKKGLDMLLGKAMSKNGVVVAAVEEVVNYTSASDVVMSDFSNYGPADDFRIKPDISAKGVNVYSSMYEFPKPPNSIYSEPLNTVYAYNDGTSMAAPAVTGVFTLWQQWAIENSEDGVPFRSATLRALMAHTADEAGSTPGPDHIFGWGVLNASKAVQVLQGTLNESGTVLEENTLEESKTYTKVVTANENVDKIIVTLAWTDPEGTFHTSNFNSEQNVIPALVNDLDLIVTKNGEEFLPWKLNKDFNDLRAIKGNNDVDNIEKVEIDNVTPGQYTVAVSHKGTLRGASQEYTLVVSMLNASGTLSTTDITTPTTESFKIWPNPVSEVLNISAGQGSGFDKVSYTIYDLTGKVVLKGANQFGGSFEVSVSDLAHGVYFVEIQSASLGKTTQKFIKK